MAIPNPNAPKDQKALDLLAKHQAREVIHFLVLKINSWKFGLLEGALIKPDNKITSKEWRDYTNHITGISKTESVEKVKRRLSDTHEAIKSHGGFAS